MLLRYIFCCYICFLIRYSNAGAGAGYTFYPLSIVVLGYVQGCGEALTSDDKTGAS